MAWMLLRLRGKEKGWLGLVLLLGAVAWSCHGNSMISVRNGSLHDIPGILPGSKSSACLRSLLVAS